MRHALELVARHSGALLASGICVGVLWPEAATRLRPLLPLCIAGLLLTSMVRVPWAILGSQLARGLELAGVLVWLLLVSPLVMWLVLGADSRLDSLGVALVLMAATPPLFSTPAMAFLWGLDAPLALAVVMVATLVGPFTLAAVAVLVFDLEFGVSPIELSARLALLVGGCLALALVVRHVAGGERIERWRSGLDAAALLLLLVFAVAVMDGVRDRWEREPALVLVYLAAAFAANLVLQGAGFLVARPLGRVPALTVGYASGNRSMGLLLAVLPPGSAPDLVLFFALGQLPIYLLPAVLAPLYRRASDARP